MSVQQRETKADPFYAKLGGLRYQVEDCMGTYDVVRACESILDVIAMVRSERQWVILTDVP